MRSRRESLEASGGVFPSVTITSGVGAGVVSVVSAESAVSGVV